MRNAWNLPNGFLKLFRVNGLKIPCTQGIAANLWNLWIWDIQLPCKFFFKFQEILMAKKLSMNFSMKIPKKKSRWFLPALAFLFILYYVFSKKMPNFDLIFEKKIIKNQKLMKQTILKSQITQYNIFSAVKEGFGKKKCLLQF
jgi:hypothetical protein